MATIKTLNLNMGALNIPLKIKSNGYSSNKIRFNQLHKGDKGRIGYKKYCKKCNEEVKKENITKAYKLGDKYIPIDKDLLDKLKKSSKLMKVLGTKKDVSERLLNDYYILDVEEEFIEQYETLKEALRLKSIGLIVSFVLRRRENLGLIKAEGEHLILYKLKKPNLLKNLNDVVKPKKIDVSEKNIKMFIKLLNYFNDYNLEEYRDKYTEKVKEIIKKKARGEETEIEEVKEEKKDFEESLEETLKVMSEESELEKVKPKQKVECD